MVSAAVTLPANTQKRSDTTNIVVSAAASSLANTQKRSDTTNIVVSGAARSPAKHRSAQALFARPVQHKLIGTDGVFFRSTSVAQANWHSGSFPARSLGTLFGPN